MAVAFKRLRSEAGGADYYTKGTKTVGAFLFRVTGGHTLHKRRLTTC